MFFVVYILTMEVGNTYNKLLLQLQISKHTITQWYSEITKNMDSVQRMVVNETNKNITGHFIEHLNSPML